MQYLALLHGRRPRLFDVIGAHFFAAFLTGYVLALAGIDPPQSLILLALTWWLGAGLVSHATQATRDAWGALNNRALNAIWITIHVLLVPALTVWPERIVPEDPWTVIFLNMLMLAKVMLFIAGERQNRKPTK